jgi:hypothetical protein
MSGSSNEDSLFCIELDLKLELSTIVDVVDGDVMVGSCVGRFFTLIPLLLTPDAAKMVTSSTYVCNLYTTGLKDRHHITIKEEILSLDQNLILLCFKNK